MNLPSRLSYLRNNRRGGIEQVCSARPRLEFVASKHRTGTFLNAKLVACILVAGLASLASAVTTTSGRANRTQKCAVAVRKPLSQLNQGRKRPTPSGRAGVCKNGVVRCCADHVLFSDCAWVIELALSLRRQLVRARRALSVSVIFIFDPHTTAFERITHPTKHSAKS